MRHVTYIDFQGQVAFAVAAAVTVLAAVAVLAAAVAVTVVAAAVFVCPIFEPNKPPVPVLVGGAVLPVVFVPNKPRLGTPFCVLSGSYSLSNSNIT